MVLGIPIQSTAFFFSPSMKMTMVMRLHKLCRPFSLLPPSLSSISLFSISHSLSLRTRSRLHSLPLSTSSLMASSRFRNLVHLNAIVSEDGGGGASGGTGGGGSNGSVSSSSAVVSTEDDGTGKQFRSLVLIYFILFYSICFLVAA